MTFSMLSVCAWPSIPAEEREWGSGPPRTDATILAPSIHLPTKVAPGKVADRAKKDDQRETIRSCPPSPLLHRDGRRARPCASRAALRIPVAQAAIVHADQNVGTKCITNVPVVPMGWPANLYFACSHEWI